MSARRDAITRIANDLLAILQDSVPGRGLRGWIGEEAYAQLSAQYEDCADACPYCGHEDEPQYTITEAGKAYLEGRE